MLTMEYNPDANGKIEQGHTSIVKALVNLCDGKVKNWPQQLPYADRTMHTSLT